MILKKYNFDLATAIEAQKSSPLGYGSEFLPPNTLQKIFASHPLWQRMERLLIKVSKWPLTELSMRDRIEDLNEALQFGNHKEISELDKAIVQLTGLGIFFAFRSCKYLKVPQAKQRQTLQIRLRNIRFHKGGEVIPHTHPDIEFTNNIAISFERQKREQKHDTITHEASGDSVLCPVKFAAGLV